MRKVLCSILFSILLAIPQLSFAGLGTQLNGTSNGEVHKINFTGPTTITKTGGTMTLPVVDSTMIAAGAANGGATSMTSSTLVVPVSFAYVRKAIANDAAFTAGTLADGVKGQLLTIHITEQLGSEVFTITPTTSTHIASIGMDAADEIVTLLFVDSTTGWVLAGDTNATINTY